MSRVEQAGSGKKLLMTVKMTGMISNRRHSSKNGTSANMYVFFCVFILTSPFT